MDRKKMIEVANLLKIEPRDEVLNELEKEFDEIMAALEKIRQIDVTNIEPLARIEESPQFYLREDEIDQSENLVLEKILSNAKDSNDQFIRIKKVI
ncbi:Asp-tRNA(Asn)/Glu-tRNA(Gln) amidotransferase subunit GatC [Mycoplasma iguanae]|uniref:Asp-tRNA(Asn)/Glu-tRNA(Gln) amidotransferase subunit GatC n=1 Tax=Mycoplasma iguanae TaxID=292461 RepID=A0ABY5R8U7_9MOLU|nr:Asp-tRNA(Asn)/Glu-tRNA(Gln) amidotransferase subunit GatC [Mycoplasma iguanae]UVD81918.1 Asp-tRNA(Asn)/Glu-tRNA(Gln) amidotransferase subunit GatC [Mycoplasma iguanae]